MKITDVSLTLFSWESIPSTIYGHHTARPTGKSDLGLLAITTDQSITGHAFLGRDREQAEIALAGRPRCMVAINRRRDALPGEQGQADIGDFHWVSSITSADKNRLTDNLAVDQRLHCVGGLFQREAAPDTGLELALPR